MEKKWYKVRVLAEMFGVSHSVMQAIVCRSEFSKFRAGADCSNRAILVDLNDESTKLIKDYLKRRKERYDSRYTPYERQMGKDQRDKWST